MKSNKQLVLGSKSPRRKELMEGLGIDFIIRTKDTDERFPSSLIPKETPLYIAQKKTDALLVDLRDNEIILCADTVVIIENTILGKPENEMEAITMLKQLSGKTHEVVTGVIIASKEKKVSFSVTTKVTFKNLSHDEIEYYITNYKPFDKAGAYGVQEWIGYIGVTSIEGSYFNVVGLPTYEVYQALLEF